jgi:hypothetical protein
MRAHACAAYRGAPAFDALGREAPLQAVGHAFYPPKAMPMEILSPVSPSGGSGSRLGAHYSGRGLRPGGSNLCVRSRAAAFTFGFPGSGRFFRIELSSSRFEARAPLWGGGPQISAGPVLLSMLAAGLTLFWALSPRGGHREAAQAAALVQVQPPAVARPATAPQEQPAPKAEVAAASSQAQPSVAPVAAAALAPVGPPPPEQVATSRPASIKAQPDQKAQVLHSVPPKVILTVFDKKNDWLQVGSTYAWGWVHSSSVHEYSPPGAPATATAR